MRNRVTMMLSLVAVAVAVLPWAAGLVGAGHLARPLLQSDAPTIVSYQGQLHVAGLPYDGTGYFKFAIVDETGTITRWSSDGTSSGGSEPDEGVQLTVTNGVFNVLLGDTSVENMTEPLDAAVFADPECYLRVWFSDDASPFQQLSPDRRIAAVPYALQAKEAGNANMLGGHLAGNTSGRIPINNGALNTSLNADKLDGKDASALGVPGGAMVLGFPDDARLTGAGYTDMGPSIELWRSTTNALTGRCGHTAVWTGSEMIVWGGEGSSPTYKNDGARFDPATDTWTPITTTYAPEARAHHTAVWTGSEMIVWGGRGSGGPLNSGGRYDPATDSWRNIATVDAPSARNWHTAVWTGSEMIVWGGYASASFLYSGGRYDPAADAWTPTTTTNAPAGRSDHTAVWTGSEMIVWGGCNYSGSANTGGRYDPASDTWTPTSTVNAPAGRWYHTAVWTGSEMLIWGGLASSGDVSSGSRYDPAIDGWSPITALAAPAARERHTAVWTGSEMIVWGGYAGATDYLYSGGRYKPAMNTWTDVTTSDVPCGRGWHTSVWTGSEMIVWGGQCGPGCFLDNGARYCRLHLYQKP